MNMWEDKTFLLPRVAQLVVTADRADVLQPAPVVMAEPALATGFAALGVGQVGWRWRKRSAVCLLLFADLRDFDGSLALGLHEFILESLTLLAQYHFDFAALFFGVGEVDCLHW